MTRTIKLYQNAWREDHSAHVNIELPEDWNVSEYEMEADALPVLTREQIKERILQPIGMPSIREMAQAGKEAVIVFDDLSRPTPVKVPAEIILEELHAAGITKEHIRFICALGNHGALTRTDFVAKLGEYIVENYAIYNHNPYENLVKVGTGSHGEDVLVNREFMNCDIRIGIGCVAPHPMNGFGGGGKLIFPGIAGIETTYSNHSRREFKPFSKETCGFRKDIENMTAMIRPFYKVDVVLNSQLDIVDAFGGDAVEEHAVAIERSAELNRMVKNGEPKDLVIVNANGKYNEALIAVRIAAQDLKEGGDIVLINHCPSGQVTHYLYSQFGSEYGGKCWLPLERRIKQPQKRLIYFTPYPDVTSKYGLNEPEKVVFAKTWEEVMKLLKDHDAGTKVSVIKDGTISYFG